MALAAGIRLGAYEILAKLGEGGMGEVYRARDTRLKRDVAIKVLPESVARDPDRLARFEREAELLATLNHPNIASIYGFEDAASISAIVLELVEGPTLAEQLVKGALAIDETLSIARQIAGALEAAHEKGIVHRDLKPANIKITPGGQVKVLDFGLAKAIDSITAPAGSASISPTMVSPATQAGIILGTAAYMSPEQARGKTVDQRADIWGFGCLLFEMLSGRSPFGSGETISDSIAAILTREPDWQALPAGTSVAVRRLLRRCLEKDVNRRLHHIGDARLELDDTSAGESAVASGGATVRSRWMAALPWAIAAIGFGAAAFAIVWPRPDSAAPAARVTRLELNLPADVELFTSARTVALSPDGARLAFVGVQSGARHVFLRTLDQFDVVPLRGTDNASMCFFSPDGASIGFVTSSGILKTVSVADSVVTTVADEVGFLGGGAWTADGTIVFQRMNTLWRVPRTGGAPRPLTTLDAAHSESRHAWPLVLPGGRTVLFGATSNDRSRIDAIDLSTVERRTVVENGTLPLYTTTGQLAFYRDGKILAVPFDAAALKVTGPPVQVLDNIPVLTSGVPPLDISPSGTVVYSPTIAVSRLVWVSRRGEEQIVNDDRRSYMNPRVSPDGQRVIVQAGDLWMQDLTRGTFSRLTSGDILANGFPIWMPDGRVMYRSQSGLRIQGTNAPGDAVHVVPGTTDLDYPAAVAPDGDTVLFLRSTESSSFNILALSLGDATKMRPIVQTPAYESGARLSPDGRWLLYVSNETGRNEIYVTSYPSLGERLQVSTQGGTQAIWNPNGKEIFYRIDDKMMAVDVTTGPALKLSPPKVLFDARYAYGAGITISNFDISRDGQRFIMVKPESGAGRLNVVLNRFADHSRERAAGSN
jgi:eukaryotic-like serine/threonine-protein kinase